MVRYTLLLEQGLPAFFKAVEFDGALGKLAQQLHLHHRVVGLGKVKPNLLGQVGLCDYIGRLSSVCLCDC